jgi:hypothetical protein
MLLTYFSLANNTTFSFSSCFLFTAYMAEIKGMGGTCCTFYTKKS